MMQRIISGLLVLVLFLVVGISVWAESLEELKIRAKKGDAIAQLNLGMMYSRGLGVSENIAEATVWYRMAAEQGSPEAKAELDRISMKSVSAPNKPTVGTIPTGNGTLDIQTNPPDTEFYVFTGYTFVFSGSAPFRIEDLRAGEYNICFEKQGYDLFWKSSQIDSRSSPLNVTLRQVDPQRSIPSCVDSNAQTRAHEVYEAEDRAEKTRKDAERAKVEAEKAAELSRMLDTRGLTCKEIGARMKAIPKGSRERQLIFEIWLRQCNFR